jgi:predicted metalloprotease with PDZ domain
MAGDLLNVAIDGMQLSVPKDTSIIEAAKQALPDQAVPWQERSRPPLMRSMPRRSVTRSLAAALAVTALTGSLAHAQQPEAIRYVLRIPAPETHYIEVQATYPTSRQRVIELMMPVWTPGSYLVREFARHVEEIRARDPAGRALQVDKSRKNRWRVETGGASAIVLTYRVYAHERQARTNWVEDSFGLINGAPTFITLVERVRRPHDVTLEVPAAWARSLTSLPAAADGRPHHYRAPDFDALVDSPILAGNPAVYEFTVDGVPHTLVNVGEAGTWDGARAARDVERIVRAGREFWGSLPYERYLFFNLLVEGYDGIEHKESTVLLTSRWSTRTDSAYHDWLILVAHEFFHAWNVKRLRPVELGPFDYENEVYTRSLWIAEGLSDYYSWLLARRSGLATREQTLGDISTAIGSLQTTPGRLVQPLDHASYDAWIKQYRPDENSANAAVSYYTKGSIVGLLLDAKLRRLTNGARGLDDVMRVAYRRFSGGRGYTPSDFLAVANEVGGADLGEFFHRALETTEELDYAEMLDWYGLRFNPPAPGTRAKAWLGVDTRVDDGRLLVSALLRGTPAYGSGLTSDDELIAIDDFRLDTHGLDDRLEQYQPGDKVTLLVSRRGELRRFGLTLGSAPTDRWSLSVSPEATREQRRRLMAWLGDGK